MSTVDSSSTYYNSVSDYNKTSTTGRKVSSSSSGDTIVSEGDTSAFKETESMGKDDFLNLLVTQLKYQNPLEPAADTEFVAQLAQFTQLENSMTQTEALSKLSENMNTFMTLQTLNSQSMTNASATPLLGKNVRVSVGDFSHTSGKTHDLDVHLNEGYSTGVLQILDSNDKVIREIPVTGSNSKGGDYEAKWDGLDSEGKTVTSGTYTFSLVNSDGKSTAGYVWDEGKVSSVGFGETGASLTINDVKYALKNLVTVTDSQT